MNDVLLPYANSIIKLLQGVVYSDDSKIWNELLNYQNQLKEYFLGIGIELYISENEGFSFLKQKEFDSTGEMENKEEYEKDLPSLFIKRQLSYPVTLLCVLLLEKLIEFDIGSADSTRLILCKDDIKQMIDVFLPAETNEAKMSDSIDTGLNRLVEYGFLKQLSGSTTEYEVRRILKAKIPVERLDEIKHRLKDYAAERT
jgi:hypothetical protein